MNDRLKKLIYDKNTVLAFDIDGVLFPYEVGEYNHGLLENDWKGYLKDHLVYTGEPIKIFKDLIHKRRSKGCRDYVISRSLSDEESEQKRTYISDNYDIDINDIFFVRENDEKLDILEMIFTEEEKRIVMIDDSVEVLNYIMENSIFYTIHVSSFLNDINSIANLDLTGYFYLQNKRLAQTMAKYYGIEYEKTKEIVEYVNNETIKMIKSLL